MSVSVDDIDYAQRIGSNIAKLLEARGMTQADLARRLGVSRAGINKYVVGVAAPHPRNIVRIAAALGVSTDELLLCKDIDTTGIRFDPAEYIYRSFPKLTGEQLTALAGVVQSMVAANEA